jgi:hypothetical protein
MSSYYLRRRRTTVRLKHPRSDSTKRNANQAALHRTPGRTQRKSRGLAGVREAADFALDSR